MLYNRVCFVGEGVGGVEEVFVCGFKILSEVSDLFRLDFKRSWDNGFF